MPLTLTERPFSILNMRSVVQDITARARIRDAAVAQFASHGFGVSVRGIAEAAGVSPGLVIHHFGSKAGLREACDELVLDEIRRRKLEAIGEGRAPDILRELGRADEWAPLLGYLLRTFTTGGPLARTFFAQMVRDTEDYLSEGERAGNIQPSRNPRARARYLVMQSVGASLVQLVLTSEPDEVPDFRQLMQDLVETSTLPALELMTEGLVLDRTPLDTYVDYLRRNVTVEQDPTDEDRLTKASA